VDSVAEHQPARAGMYVAYLNLPLDYAWHAVAVCLLNRTNGSYFVALYAFIAMHFSGKMSRLVLICGPIVAIGCGLWCGFILDFITEPFLLLLGKQGYHKALDQDEGGKNSGKGNAAGKADGKTKAEPKTKADAKGKAATGNAKKGGDKEASAKASDACELCEWEEEERPGGMAQLKRTYKASVYAAVPASVRSGYHRTRMVLDRNPLVLLMRAALSVGIVVYTLRFTDAPEKTATFVKHCHQVAMQLSNPKVVRWENDRIKGRVKMDDYLRGYEWIDKNTPKDARVIAWWDYGYQITGIAKRTSIADGNTWNHEHIATLGRTLTSPEKKAHNAIRHIADYLLVWAGGGGDDLGKSPHLARIGNSVYPDHCGDDDPRCNKFGFYSAGRPTPMMEKSLLYKAVMHNLADGVKLSPKFFKEVHTTRNGKMRVFKVMNVSEESKAWIADPKNRICDAPGSWYCVGQYPPALQKLIAKRRNFAQVEDFNKVGQKSAYTKMVEKERGGEL